MIVKIILTTQKMVATVKYSMVQSTYVTFPGYSYILLRNLILIYMVNYTLHFLKLLFRNLTFSYMTFPLANAIASV